MIKRLVCNSFVTSTSRHVCLAAVMQLFTCHVHLTITHPHIQLYLKLGMLCPEWLTFVSIETGVRFQWGLCNWIWWIWPFLDNGAVQLRGHQRALTLYWLLWRQDLLLQTEQRWLTFPHLPFPSFLCVHGCMCVFVCMWCRIQFVLSFSLLLSEISTSSCSLQLSFSHNLHLLQLLHPASFPFISSLLCACAAIIMY